jgi:hypothetical protein
LIGIHCHRPRVRLAAQASRDHTQLTAILECSQDSLIKVEDQSNAVARRPVITK